MVSRFPARLHVLFAQDNHTAVVLRRGPSRTVCSIGWNRRDDSFTAGQWLRARIYERRADLSPDGRYLIYFALNGRWESSTGGSWTAISRAPYLKAVALFGKGDGWHGGGLFTGKRTYWLNDGAGHRTMKATSELARDMKYKPEPYFGGECPGVYYHRLLRDGWAMGEYKDGPGMQSSTIFDKPMGRGWILRKIAHAQVGAPPGNGCYWDEHQIVHVKAGSVEVHPDWEWAEMDRGSVVFAAAGRLYRVRLARSSGLQVPTLLHDFNDMKFEAIEAPYG